MLDFKQIVAVESATKCDETIKKTNDWNTIGISLNVDEPRPRVSPPETMCSSSYGYTIANIEFGPTTLPPTHAAGGDHDLWGEGGACWPLPIYEAYIYIYIYIYICIHEYTYIYTVSIYTYIHVCLHICIYVHTTPTLDQ